MRPEIRRLTSEQFLSLLAAVRGSLTRKITAVHLHHTWRPTRAQFRGLASIEAMRNYHIGLGWDDIAQHLTIDPVGICWTGRNWNLPPASQKGKNGTPDAGPFMIEMVGDFDGGQEELDGEQRRAVCAVVAGLVDQCSLDAKDIYFHRELGSPKSCPGTGVDKKQLVTEIVATLTALRAIPASTGARGPAGKKRGAKPSAKPLPLPVEFLVSRDVADPVGPPLAGYEDSEAREDRLAARTIAEESARRVLLFSDVSTVLTRGGDEWRELRPHVVNLAEGKLSRTGEFKMDDDSIADIVASIRQYAESTAAPRLMLHAPGDSSARSQPWDTRRAPTPGGCATASTRSTSSGKPELSRSSRTGLGSAAGSATGGTVDSSGSLDHSGPAWDDMKDYALKSSAANAGGGEAGGARTFAQALLTLLANPPGGKRITLHAVGHSAGAIFHRHFVPMLDRYRRDGRQPSLPGASRTH